MYFSFKFETASETDLESGTIKKILHIDISNFYEVSMTQNMCKFDFKITINVTY